MDLGCCGGSCGCARSGGLVGLGFGVVYYGFLARCGGSCGCDWMLVWVVGDLW